ncbi:MAG: PAS domain-containing protein [Flavobacterium sp.]|jgi:PAS domain S-box-containing protein
MANNELTYKELENQIIELKKQNEILRLNNSIQEDEIGREYYYNTILNKIGDPVFVKDEQSRLLIVNDAFRDIFKLKREDIIGKTLAEHVPQEERESFLKIDKQVLEDGIENINEETLTVKGEKTQIISTRKSRFIDADGKKYLIGVIHDITERKKSEDSHKENEERLKGLNTTKDKLFSIIAHDLRTPFDNIIGLTELILENAIDFEESEKYIKILNSSAKNTLILLDNLLNWAKIANRTAQLHPKKNIYIKCYIRNNST